MNDNKLLLSGVCPYCPATLDYSEDSRAVVCHSCGNVIPTRILRPLDFAKRENIETENDRRIADGVTSSSAGVIYFDNFCESYDWREFALHSRLSVPTLDSVAEACKLKFSADPITYYLDFRCRAIPVLKKIEGLDVLEVEIIDNYKSDDISDLFEYVDRYSSITKEIENKREAIITELERDIKLAKRFAILPYLLADLKRTLAMFKEKVNAISSTSNIEEIPGYAKAKAIKDAKLAEDIRKKGIDAEKTYVKGIELLEKGNVDNALHLFAAINGYKDTEKLIKENSIIFKFNEELAELAGKYYIVKRAALPVFEPSNPVPVSEGSLSFYEIKNKIPSDTPALTGVTKIIHSFGTKIFYLRSNVSICCYDTLSTNYSANVKILDEAPYGDYVLRHENPIYYSSDKTKFFIRKKLRETTTEKRGCFGLGRKKKKKIKEAENRGNNYSVLLVDMDNATSKIILPEIVDIMDYYNDKIFYTALDKDASKPVFRVYDIATETITDVLDSNYFIHSVSNGKIVYSLKFYSENNMDLYSMDIATKESIRIDSNVRKYYAMNGNRVFYIVGSRDDKRLYAANLDGTDKCEIMENPGRICTFSSGWLYYVNGTGINTCLMKVSTDGKKNMLVASRFGALVKVLNGYIYYIATNGDLKFVRSDGTNDFRIAPAIGDLSKIIIDKEKIYYLKDDDFGKVIGNRRTVGHSLYSTDLYGKNLRKLSHDVFAMAEYNERYIYICKKRAAAYEIYTPVDRRTTTNELYSKSLTYYESYDRVNDEFTEIVRLGQPTTSLVTYKKSWLPFSKYITEETAVNEIDTHFNIYPNVRDNVAEVGMVEKEEEREEQKRLEELAEAKNAKKKARRERRDARKEKKLNKKAKKEAKRLNLPEDDDDLDMPAEEEIDEERRRQLEEELRRVEAEETKRENSYALNPTKSGSSDF